MPPRSRTRPIDRALQGPDKICYNRPGPMAPDDGGCDRKCSLRGCEKIDPGGQFMRKPD